VDLGGGRRLWRHDAGSKISRKNAERDLLYVQPTNLSTFRYVLHKTVVICIRYKRRSGYILRTDVTDSSDCIPILVSISVFTF